MSAIAGLWYWHGEPVASRDLERMANALAPYGPDRSEIAVAGPVGFAHALMRMTPEDRFDRQPMRAAGGVLMTADLRLDNRDEMLDRIGVNRADSLAWSDSRVLLAAWEKLGDDVWPMLRGPFAAAIWNPTKQTLTLARDHLGLNVVLWHKNERFFAFATMPKGLFALPDVPRQVNEEKIADFLVLNHAEHETTIYRNVFRVAPAHVVKVDASGAITAKRYWSQADIAPVRLASDEAYAEGLRAVLDRAVRRQLRSAYPVAAFLSGGLDSSATTAMAARALDESGQRLAAYTQVPRKGFTCEMPRTSYADETPLVEAIRKMTGNLDVTYVYNDEHDDFADLDRVSLAFEGPVRNATNLGWLLAIPRLAQEQNQRVLLDGVLGNSTASWDGWSQASHHLRQGRLALAFRQYQTYYRVKSESRWTSFRKLFINPILTDGWLDWNDRRRSKTSPWLGYSAIRADFAAEMQVEARARRVGHDFRYRLPFSKRFSLLTVVDYAGEWYAAIKAMYGVEIRIPLADIDLVEYCFGIPPEQYLVEDVDRSLIRRAMWGLLPPVVLANRRIGAQAADWYEKATARRERLRIEIAELATSPLARRALDLDRLQNAIDTWPTSGWYKPKVYNEYQLALTRGISAGRFLRWVDAQNR